MGNRSLNSLNVLREVIVTSGPLMLAMSGYALTMIVDRICLTLHSKESLEAFGPSVFTSMTMLTFGTGFVFSMQAYIASSSTEGGAPVFEKRFGDTVAMAGVVAAIVTAFFPVIIFATAVSGRPTAVVNLEQSYLLVAWAYIPIVIFNTAWTCLFTALGKTSIVFRTNFVGQTVSVLASILLIFGIGPLPELGIIGSGIGTLLGTALISVGYVVQAPAPYRKELKTTFTYPVAALVKIRTRIKNGVFVGLTDASDEAGNTAIMWATGLLGAASLAANNFNIILNWIAVLPMIGLGDGANAIAGKKASAGDREGVQQTLLASIGLAWLYGAIITVSLYVGATHVSDAFSLRNYGADVWAMSIGITQILWLYAAAFGLSYPTARVLQAVGLSSFVLRTRLFVMFGLSVTSAFWISTTFPHEQNAVVYIWISLSLFELLVGIVLLARLTLWARTPRRAELRINTN